MTRKITRDEIVDLLGADEPVQLVETLRSEHFAQGHSRIAAEKLAKLGYTNVRRYEEGKQDWDEAGLELEVLA